MNSPKQSPPNLPEDIKNFAIIDEGSESSLDSRESKPLAKGRIDATLSTEQKIKLNNNRTATWLAIISLAAVCVVIGFHISQTFSTTRFLLDSNNSLDIKERQELADKADAITKENSQILYTFLGTLTVSVFAFYFGTMNRSKNSEDE